MYVHPKREKAMSSPELRHMKLIIFQAEKNGLLNSTLTRFLWWHTVLYVSWHYYQHKNVVGFSLKWNNIESPGPHHLDRLLPGWNSKQRSQPVSSFSIQSEILVLWFHLNTEAPCERLALKSTEAEGGRKQQENKGENVGATRRSQLACRLHRWNCSTAPGCMRAEQQFVNCASSPEKQRVSKSGGVGMKERRQEGWKQFENLLAEARGRKRHLYAGLNFGTLAFCD